MRVFIAIFAIIVGLFFAYDFNKSVVLYVSTTGNDQNDASFNKPLKTLIKALELARNTKDESTQIWLRKGVYHLDNTIVLSSQDTREENSPLTISSYKNESVTISGGAKLPFWSRKISKNAKDKISATVKSHIYTINLNQYGITDFGSPNSGGVELYYNDKKMQLARFPNAGGLTIGDLVEPNTMIVRNHTGSAVGKFFYQDDLPEIWKQEKDIWLDGYWFWDWRDERQQVKEINTEQKIITLQEPYHGYGYRSGQEYFAYNLLSELDVPNEWYLDRETGDLYFYPEDDIDRTHPPEITSLDSIFELNDVSHITIKNLIISLAKKNGVAVLGGSNNTLENIVVKHIGEQGVTIEDSPLSQIVSSEVYSVGGIAISISGGDRDTLTSANICAINNQIHDYAMVKKTYQPGILLRGVGNCAQNNEIYNAPHSAIIYHGNNHLIEYNDIHHVVKQSNDAGAIYGGRDWSSRGHVIRYNYLHDIYGFKGEGAMGVYLDDELSGITIYGNIFDNVDDAIYIGGGRDNIVENNLFIHSEPSIYVDARGQSWAKGAIDQQITQLNRVPYSSPKWVKQYPKLPKVLTENQRLPVDNIIRNNVFYDSNWEAVIPEAKPYVNIGDNYTFFSERPTADYQVNKENIMFKNIPFKNIGLKRQ